MSARPANRALRWTLPLAALGIAAVAWLLLHGPGPRVEPSLEVDSRPASRPADRNAGTVLLASVDAGDTAPEATRVEAAPPVVAPAAAEFPPMRARVTLVVRANGEPLEGAAVRLAEAVDPVFDGPPGADAPVGADSVPRTNAVGEASFFVRSMRTVSAEVDFAERGWALTTTFTSPLDGKTRRIPVNLTPPGTLGEVELLVVSEPGGAALPGASISVSGIGGFYVDIDTDERGVAAIPRSVDAKLTVKASDHATRTVTTLPEEPEGQAQIALRRHARIHGVIECAGWTAVGGEDAPTVTLHVPAERSDPFRGAVGRLSRSISVDAEGRWSIEGIEIPEGMEQIEGVTVTAVVGGLRHLQTKTLTLAPGDDKEIVDPWRGAPPWTLRFVDAAGGALSAAHWVGLNPRGSGPELPRTSAVVVTLDDDGYANLPAFPVGTWEYVLGGPLATYVTFAHGDVVHLGDETTTVRIEDAGSIVGKFTSWQPSHSSNGSVEVTAHRGGRFVEVPVNRNGRFRIDLVPEGSLIDLVVKRSPTRELQSGEEIGVSIFEQFVELEKVEILRVTLTAGDRNVELQLPE